MNRKGTMKLSGLVFTFVLAGLFFYLMVSFGYNLAVQNDVNTTLLNNSRLSASFVDVESQISTSYGEVTNSTSAFDISGNEEGAVSPNVATAKTSATTGKNNARAFYNVIGSLTQDIFGLDPVFLTTMSLLFAFSSMYLIWRFFRTGQ